jgi:hypothetical protein
MRRTAVPQQELLLLLATGSATPPLAAFLSSSLGEAGLRRLARGLDTAASGLHTALLERLGPLAELTLFLLGELRGAVAAAGGASWLGLQVRVWRVTLHQGRRRGHACCPPDVSPQPHFLLNPPQPSAHAHPPRAAG